jgi:hypothetical protein
MLALRRSLTAFIAVLLTVWIVPAMLDWNRYRTEIADFAAAELGRPVSIGGDVTLKLLPRAVLTAADVTFPDQGDGVSARLHALRLEVAVLPLLRGRLVVRDLVLGTPELRLPWPLPANLGSPVRPYVRHPFTARVEGGSVALGALAVTGIDAALRSDTATGTLRIAGGAALAGAPWRFTTTLGTPDADGRASVFIGIDGQDAFQGTEGHFAGSLSAGIAAGEVEGHGPDLAQLIAAPHGAWHARGPFTAAAGLLALPQLAFAGGGAEAQGRILLRITRPAGLDLGVSVQSLDASLWTPALAAMQAPALPLRLTLDAAHVALLGGDVQDVRLSLALDAGDPALERASATLPGGALLTLSGRAGRDGSGFFVEGPATLDAPDLRATLAWLHPLAPTLIGPPPGASPHHASIEGSLRATARTFSVSGMTGHIDGTPISGGFGMALPERPGADPGFGMGLVVDRMPLEAFGAVLPRFDGDVFIKAADATWRGRSLGALDAALHSTPTGMTLTKLTLDGAAGTLSLAGTLGADMSLTGMHGAASTRNLPALAAAAAKFGFPAQLLQPGLWEGGATVEMTAAGPAHGWRAQIHADAGDLRLEAEASIDAGAPSATATLTIRHPGAPRLLAALGAEHAERWLETGSFALLAQISATPTHMHVANLDVTAATLRASGRLDADLSGTEPTMTATLDVDTLPLPWRERFPAAWLQGWSGVLHVRAERVLADLQPVAQAMRADVTVQDGAILADPVSAAVGDGGSVTGQAAADAGQLPARVAATLTFTDLKLTDALTGLPVDIGAGTLSGTADMAASGTGAPAWLASCTGGLALQFSGVQIAGLDLPRVTRVASARRPSAKALAAALATGTSPGFTGTVSGAMDHGRLTLGPSALSSPAGALGLSGTLMLDESASDLVVAVTPAVPSPPPIHLHLSGPWNAARVQTDIGKPPSQSVLKRKDTHPRRK